MLSSSGPVAVRQRAASADMADAVIVLAPEPPTDGAFAGPRTGLASAARLAGAALEDTLVAVEGTRIRDRVLSSGGDARRPWLSGLQRRGFEVVERPSGRFDEQLLAAFTTLASRRRSSREPGRPRAMLVLGTATPQVSAQALETSWGGADAVLGLSDDGGYWAIGLRETVDPRPCLAGMSPRAPRGGSAQLNRLVQLGLEVTLLPPLRPVGRPSDAELVAYSHPRLLFSEVHRQIADEQPDQSVDRLFDRGYAGLPLDVQLGARRPVLEIDVDRWCGPADEVDRLVAARCEAPVLDLGCGPGRLVRAVSELGLPALGIDISANAVDLSMRSGAPALRARLEDPLPGEGRWGTVLLIDGNVGIGGDVPRLLTRCRNLVVPGGLVICAVDPARGRHDVVELQLSSRERTSSLPWSSIGADALESAAAPLDLRVVEEWSAGGRTFIALRRGS